MNQTLKSKLTFSSQFSDCIVETPNIFIFVVHYDEKIRDDYEC